MKAKEAPTAGSEELLRLQVNAFRQQIPLMYGVVCSNAFALGWTHFDVAPFWLSVICPILLALVSALRVISWWRVRRQVLTNEHAKRVLRSTHIFALVLGASFVSWSLLMAPLGDAYQQMHVAIFMGLTSFACATCLMHVRTAALLFLGVALVPFTYYYASSGNFVLIAIAGNIAMVAGLVIIVQDRYYRDFSALAQSRAEARQLHGDMAMLAGADSLTKLANRRRFFINLGEEITQASLAGTRLSIALIDLDGFKQVNDVHGHSTGDQILVTVAERLRAVVDNDAVIARLGGDEFAIILAGGSNDAELRAHGLALCLALREPIPVGNIVAQIGASVGIASYPDKAKTAEELYECADYALYRAKNEAPGTTALFTKAHKGRIRRLSMIEQRLRAPEVVDELSLVFQPIVDMRSGKAIAFEALARWTHAELGPIPPDIFIRAAERSGAITRITQLLYVQALRALQDWPDNIVLSFNLSAHDLVATTSVSQIIETAALYGIRPTRIQLEITETALLKDFDKAKRSVERLKFAGFRIALDDFGVGYSSLSYLHSLAFDRIKIDKSFTDQLDTHDAGRSIVRTIIDLSESLGMDCVVEGIETERQSQLAQRLGCKFAQGHHFARPMVGEKIEDYLAAQNGADRDFGVKEPARVLRIAG